MKERRTPDNSKLVTEQFCQIRHEYIERVLKRIDKFTWFILGLMLVGVIKIFLSGVNIAVAEKPQIINESQANEVTKQTDKNKF